MKARNAESGIILIGALVTMIFLMVVATAVIDFSLNHYASSRRSLVTLDALAVSEAGGDYFMQQINKPGSTYTGTGGEYTFFNDAIRGKGTYQTSVANGTIANEKVITSIGRIYLPRTATTPLVTRKIKLIIAQSVSYPYTVQSGPGGLLLNNNVHIATGPIYLGGKLTLSNNATIGSLLLPVDVYAQDVACPVPPTGSYPSQCTTSPPYTITTSNNSHIYGNVYAANGVDTPARVTGTISNTVPAINYPVIDHDTVTTAHGWTTSAASSVSCILGLGSIAANTHFTHAGGISVPSNCTVTVGGDVWVDGALTLGNNDALLVATGLGSEPKLIIDGYSSAAGSSLISGNNTAFVANAGGFGLEVLTYYSFAAAGNGANGCSPSCASVSGPELYNSQNHDTLVIGNNFSAAVGTTFYARWTGITINNNVTVGQLVGQHITLGNNGNIIFAGLTGVGGTTTWDVKYWEQVYP